MTVQRIMSPSSERSFPLNAKDYELYEEVGEGVSATVYRAICIPLNVPVAIKVLDLEKCNNDSILANIRREVQTMCSIDHPNVLRSYCSFANDHKLWVVMPFMAGGSCLHIMKSTHPEGFEEPVIATLLYDVLKALAYLHGHGYIHRDVKAGNILIDTNGSVKLADFGVSACMFDTGDRQRSRNTFVGTPCWMAPEVMQQLHGYDFKADIWSFGITALELARGHAPFSKYPPMKVLLMTLQNAPPGLDYKKDKRFSKYFRSLVAACLVKDPKKRPSSEKLLKHRFFQKARSNEHIAKNIIHGLPPLGDRFSIIKAKEAELLINKPIVDDKEKLSQQEYIRGISGWNFNLEDLKNEASISQDYDGMPNTEDLELYCKQKDGYEEKPSLERIDPVVSVSHGDLKIERGASAHIPIDELKDDACADDTNVTSPKTKDIVQSEPEPHVPLQSNPRNVDDSTRKNDDDNLHRSSSIPNNVNFGEHESPSRKVNGSDDRDSVQPKHQLERNCSVGDISEGTIIRRKGRFKVTSEELSPKGTPQITPQTTPQTTINPGCEPSASSIASTVLAASVLPSLHSILQQNNIQRESLVKLMKNLEGNFDLSETGTGDLSQIFPASVREKELQALVAHLQQSNEELLKELQTLKTENAQLESQISELSNKENESCLKESDD